MMKALTIIIPAALAIAAFKFYESHSEQQSALKQEISSNVTQESQASSPTDRFEIILGDVDRGKGSNISNQNSQSEHNTQLSSSLATSHLSHSKAWSINNNAIHPRYELPPQIYEKVAVNINSDDVNALKEGSQMEVTFPDYSKHTAVISGVSYNTSSKTMIGRLANDQSSEIIMTVGRNSVYATVATSSGSYSMQSADGEGVLFKVPSRKVLETQETDALTPENL